MRSKFAKKSDTTELYVDGSGKRRFKGTKKLKQTQVYPLRYGRCVPWLQTRLV